MSLSVAMKLVLIANLLDRAKLVCRRGGAEAAWKGKALSILLIVAALPVCGAREIDRVVQGEKVGYQDRVTKQWVVLPTFGILSRGFREGLAAVEFENKSGFIDTTGRIAIALQSEWHLPGDFSEGLAAVRTSYSLGDLPGGGFIDRQGKLVIKLPGCGVAGSFSEGLAAVSMNVDGESLYGYIDQTGAMVIPPRFDRAADFKDGLAEVILADQRAVIDRKGNFTSPPVFPPEAEYTYVMSMRTTFSRGESVESIILRHKGKNRAFASMTALQEFLAGVPRGTVLKYQQTCSISSGRLLESFAEVEQLREFCAQRSIALEISPSG